MGKLDNEREVLTAFEFPECKNRVYDSMESIVKAVNNHYKIFVFERGHQRKFVEPRQLCIYLLRSKLNQSWHSLAFHFECNHATCIYGFKTIKNLLETDKEFRNKVIDLL